MEHFHSSAKDDDENVYLSDYRLPIVCADNDGSSGKESKRVDARCLNFSLQRTVRPNQHNRGRSIARILSSTARRENHRIQTIYRSKTRIRSPQSDTTYQLISREMSTFDTVAPTVRRTKSPDGFLELTEWKEFQNSVVSERDSSGSRYCKSWIPDGRKPPMLYVQISHHR